MKTRECEIKAQLNKKYTKLKNEIINNKYKSHTNFFKFYERKKIFCQIQIMKIWKIIT